VVISWAHDGSEIGQDLGELFHVILEGQGQATRDDGYLVFQWFQSLDPMDDFLLRGGFHGAGVDDDVACSFNAADLTEVVVLEDLLDDFRVGLV
jgi:hypothetical protein